jgi:ABC-type glutathione transport system ATPase component
MTTLTVRDLTVSVGQKRLVGPVDFDVEPGLPLTILGETGAGKSVLAQAVMGALPAELSAEGAITFSGTRLDRLSQREREKLWGRSIAILPQEPWLALDPLMVSAAQVAESHAEVAGRSWPEANGRARDDLAGLGLAEAAMKAHPGTLSGGMAQRVAFAAATAAGARTLLIDEPTKGLDDARRDDIVRLLKAYVAAGGVLITITHEVAVARALGGRAMILRAGEVVEAGTAEKCADRAEERVRSGTGRSRSPQLARRRCADWWRAGAHRGRSCGCTRRAHPGGRAASVDRGRQPPRDRRPQRAWQDEPS